MKIKELKELFHNKLDSIYGKDEVFTFFFMLTEAYCNISRLDVALNTNLSITKTEQEPIFNALKDLKNQKPIQYILGETEFYGLPFKVNKHTLIPRPETEELVALVIAHSKNKIHTNNTYSILDIGTGSGCIAISLAKHLSNAKVYALDISAKAIEKAKENTVLNDVNVEFIKADILNELNLDIKFDIIVSNPPYVRVQEKKAMKPNVLENEPHLALFVEDDNPLEFYNAITQFAVNNLKPKGKLYFEINEYLGQEMIQLLIDNGFDKIELRQDLFEKDRLLKGSLI